MVIEHHDKCDAKIELPSERAVVHAVTPAVKMHVTVGDIPSFGDAAVNDAVRKAASAGQGVPVAEFHYGTAGGRAALEKEAAHLKPATAYVKRRFPGDDNLPGAQRLHHDRLIGSTMGMPVKVHVGIMPVLNNNCISRLGRLQGLRHLYDDIVALPAGDRYRQGQNPQNKSLYHLVPAFSLISDIAAAGSSYSGAVFTVSRETPFRVPP